MADFYANFGSRKAQLVGVFRLGSINIKLHRVNFHHYVISRNRKVLIEAFNIDKAIDYFTSAISLEEFNKSLFNS